ncbi:helix-turn-helix domain-containing protein [Cytophagaceae bacterium SJW1-29]|uniref:Helix-turn-helix domain-containing protein n=2 Tax=Salmonirosea aquatica TaxID=2654236 RepID=A0A7C9FZL4_9BACT|nr:helix-turn-helix domain-containing protein [Cytophagaceae bacterium SJW1-29]
MSTNGDNEFFCDGITEEIINALARIDQLKVTSRTSSFHFKGQNNNISEIGKKLNVSTILEGSVRLAGDTMRITAQLINVEDDFHFWSETWDRKRENIFEIQDEISLLIADKLREHFGHLDYADHLAEVPTTNLAAYEYLLKGKYTFNKWNPEDANTAIRYFEEALTIDPDLIEAHTGLADGYSFLAVAGFAPRAEAWNKAIGHLERAKAIDPNNAPLNYLLANQAFFTEASFAGAMDYAQKSIASRPTYSEAQQFMSFLYMLRGDLKKAREHLLYAKSIDPLNVETKFYEAYFQYRSKDYALAQKTLNELLDVNAKNLPALITLAYVLLKKGAFGEVEVLLSGIPPEMIMPDEKLGLTCLKLAIKGDHVNLKQPLADLEMNATEDTSFQAHAYLFKVYCVLGRHDEAFQLLEKLFQHHSSILLLSFGDPLAEAIQTDARYPAYHQRIYPLQNDTSKTRKASTSTMDEETTTAFLDRLHNFIEQQSPYLNPSLSLRSLAELIEIHPNQLSWLLNEKVGKNFNEFINQLRVEYFKKLVVDPANSHISLIGLAYESGFNSKTVFNTAFKKTMGMTPKEYLKSQS